MNLVAGQEYKDADIENGLEGMGREAGGWGSWDEVKE